MSSSFEWFANIARELRPQFETKVELVLILPHSEESLAEEVGLAVLLTIDHANELLERMEHVHRLRMSDAAISHLTRSETADRLRLVSLLPDSEAPDTICEDGLTVNKTRQQAVTIASWDDWDGLPFHCLTLEAGPDYVRWRLWPDHARRSLVSAKLDRGFLCEYLDVRRRWEGPR